MSDAVDERGRPRVVVTGLGVKVPAGSTVAEAWAVLLAGRSVAGPITRFDPSELPIRFGCEVCDWDPVPYLGPKESRRVDRSAQLGFAAAADAIADAGEIGADPARCAVIAGTGIGGLVTLEEQVRLFLDRGPERVSPFFVPMMMPNATAGIIAIHFGYTGPNLCIATACAAGANAIGEATRLIRDGSADVAIAGGTECALTPPAFAAFARMGALSKRNDDPARASRPFDADRDGFVMGEGAAFVVLERADRARARGARAYGELAGYGTNSDAFHITAPAEGGAGAAACMQAALDDAGLGAADISHINAHGTATQLNDAAEAAAIRKVFGDAAPPVTSVKGVTGHLVGAAGAFEAIVSLLSARDGVVPPTANHEGIADDVAPLDVVHGNPRTIECGATLSNSFGFGGHNATLVVVPAD
ncbi:MAG: beta-ketoacyl-ACP synthase II [Actinobacteria bacterium]|nr:beta-ketoacyl-ACP synthase II [Actinomycetota bacterium]